MKAIMQKYFLPFLVIITFVLSSFKFPDEYGQFYFCKEVDESCNPRGTMDKAQVGDKAIFRVMFFNGFGEREEPSVPVYWAIYKLTSENGNDGYAYGDKITSKTLVETISETFPRGYQSYCATTAYQFKSPGIYRVFLISKDNWATGKSTLFDYQKRDYYAYGDIRITGNSTNTSIKNNTNTSQFVDSTQSTKPKSKNKPKEALKKLFKLPS